MVVGLHAPHHAPEVVRRLVQVGIESTAPTRELVSDILKRSTVFPQYAVVEAFLRLFRSLNDLGA